MNSYMSRYNLKWCPPKERTMRSLYRREGNVPFLHMYFVWGKNIQKQK